MFVADLAYNLLKVFGVLAFFGVPFWIPQEVVPTMGWVVGVFLYLVWLGFVLCGLLVWLTPSGKHRKPREKEPS